MRQFAAHYCYDLPGIQAASSVRMEKSGVEENIEGIKGAATYSYWRGGIERIFDNGVSSGSALSRTKR